jgi:hypothetical protein
MMQEAHQSTAGGGETQNGMMNVDMVEVEEEPGKGWGDETMGPTHN